MDRLRGCTREKPNLLHSFLPPNTLKSALLADIIWVCSVLPTELTPCTLSGCSSLFILWTQGIYTPKTLELLAHRSFRQQELGHCGTCWGPTQPPWVDVTSPPRAWHADCSIIPGFLLMAQPESLALFCFQWKAAGTSTDSDNWMLISIWYHRNTKASSQLPA